MPGIGTELKTYLKTISAVTDLVGSATSARIYQDAAKQGVAKPYVVINVVPGIVFNHLSGMSGICRSRVVVDAWGATKASAYAVAEAMRVNLNMQNHITVGTTATNEIVMDGTYDVDYEPAVKGGEQKRYRYTADYFITYAEATS